MKNKIITVIGLGLIGGSIAKGLKERTGIESIYAIDNNRESLKQAEEEGLIIKGHTDIFPEIALSDIVFVCTPVDMALDWILKVIPVVHPNCIITDACSTKSQLLKEVNQLAGDFHFVGGHPMAGSEKSGFAASKSHLFENAYYILTPCAKTFSGDIEVLTDIVKSFGSIPVQLSPELHDRVTGAISHVPHVISAGLVNLVHALDTSEHPMQKLAAGGFRDITRISSSNPHMWHSICCSNREAVIELLDIYLEILNRFKMSVLANDNDEIFSYFNNAKKFRDSFAQKITGLIPGTYEIIIDVVDKPGIIGEVATLLGNNGLNIKNINVSNSREFEGGVLIISLPDIQSSEKACQLLTEWGYKVLKR